MSKSSQIGRDLITLAEKLDKYKICKDVSELHTAGASCISTKTRNEWRYNLSRIEFSADEASGRIPDECEDIRVSLSVTISGRQDSPPTIFNPINTLLFDIEINGMVKNEEKDCYEELYSSWHLDRHQYDEESGNPTFSHPIYHMAYGGYKMENKPEITGKCIIMPAPRLIYPPMDAALGIDFILQNFKSSSSLREILADSDYRRIMINSQQRLWKPFFQSVHSFWSNTPPEIEAYFTPDDLLPLYFRGADTLLHPVDQ